MESFILDFFLTNFLKLLILLLIAINIFNI